MKLIALLSVLLILFVGCGKEEKSKTSASVQSQPTLETDQDITCSNEDDCHSGIGKIVVTENNKPTICTGFLVDFNTIATSASCLPESLRSSGKKCSQKVHVVFPKTAGLSMERAGCVKVLKASSINTRNIDASLPGLWRSDIAFLQLDSSFRKRKLSAFNKEGLPEKSELQMWTVNQLDEHSAVIERKKCVTVYNSFLNPMGDHKSSPNMLVANCMFFSSSSGAPLIDDLGEVRAVASVNSDKKIRDSLKELGFLKNPLVEMFHATNMACAPTIYNSDVLDEVECSKRLDLITLDRRRAEIVSDSMFGTIGRDLEITLSAANPYINMGVKLHGNGRVREVSYYPKCFKKLETWIDSARSGRRSQFNFDTKLSRKTLTMWMDEFAKMQSEETGVVEQTFYFQLSLGYLRQNRSVTVYMWNLKDIDTSFQNVTENCDSLL